ncbi:methyltransferase domain-containing protein [Nafulsella turpanensis]|uniref:methyltransferase domain-containing protein n=1 Tax=Nafulsella turpanensis TaxID=1265690 RepID=UPI000347466E|nr:methyltransferase domain-containing protein [Nafulsella turpanensis]
MSFSLIPGAPSFAERSKRIEIMDDLSGTGPDWNQALRELKIINQYLGGNSVTLQGLERLIKGKTFDKPLEIADIGCGGGDMLLLMAKWAKVKGIPVRLTGVDANPNIIEYARKNTAAWPEIEYLVADIFSDSFAARKFDIVTSTLFTHHFTDEQLVKMMKSLHGQARLGLVVNDLHRHPIAYHSIKLITQLASRSYMVKHDAPVSVLRAFSRKDWQQILARAGLRSYQLRWKWAFRWMLLVGH